MSHVFIQKQMMIVPEYFHFSTLNIRVPRDKQTIVMHFSECIYGTLQFKVLPSSRIWWKKAGGEDLLDETCSFRDE